nr:MAG TPA_asm: hypothetical protein [Caudoviricetes sp.]
MIDNMNYSYERRGADAGILVQMSQMWISQNAENPGRHKSEKLSRVLQKM